ncbi:MAG: hypothetical protein P9M14_12325 [Candidatus Alcyoniella australis]|nr:hypothetical protein [Candidatus Alcyoniella australis]
MSRLVTLLAAALIALTLCACDDGADDGDQLLELDDLAAVALVAPQSGDGVLQSALDDALLLLSESLADNASLSDSLPAADGSRLCVLIGERAVDFGVFRQDEIDGLNPQGFRLRSANVDGRQVVGVAGPTSIGTAYGLYELLERIGLRFFHPEQSYVPPVDLLAWPPTLDEQQSPSMERRGFHIHTMHPIEAISFLLGTDEADLPYAFRWIDWCVRNKINYVQWELLRTVDFDNWLPLAAQIAEYAHLRGVKIGIVVGFVFSQQKSYMIVPRPRELCADELRSNIDELMQVPWDHINIEMGGSEFVEADDELTVAWMDLTAEYLAQRWPGTDASVKVHCSTGQTAEHYGDINFNFLAKFADPRMGVYPHTVMFYDLEGKADVYGNQDFLYMRDFLIETIGQRPVYYYPETAYWCTFDIDVPLFMPLYLYTRWKDTVLIAGAKIDGQVVFTTGHEWGYWLQDWALARFSWDASLDWTDPLVDLGQIFGTQAGVEVGQVLTELISYQQSTLIDRGLIPYIAAEDALDELGWLVGILTHPKPITFQELYNADRTQLAGFEQQILPALIEMALSYEAWTERLVQLRTQVPEQTLPWLEELIDSVRINALRCAHSYRLYAGVCQMRGAELGLADHSADQAYVHFAEARDDIKWQAAGVVRKREAAYRYPFEWSSGWDEPGNVTSYPFRYIWTVHHVIFYTRREAQAIERNFDPLYMNFHSLLQEII